MSGMTEERLMELFRKAEEYRESSWREAGLEMIEMVAEIDDSRTRERVQRDEIVRLRAENERLITVVILAEEHITTVGGSRRGDGSYGGRLLGIIDRALGRPEPTS